MSNVSNDIKSWDVSATNLTAKLWDFICAFEQENPGTYTDMFLQTNQGKVSNLEVIKIYLELVKEFQGERRSSSELVPGTPTHKYLSI